jgi:hypothetical protein
MSYFGKDRARSSLREGSNELGINWCRFCPENENAPRQAVRHSVIMS